MAKKERVSPRRTLPRTRGAASGLLLLLLGTWGALMPFVGPYINFSYTPDKAWTWSAARGWLELMPGAITFLGGLLLLISRRRLTTLVGAWLGVAGGAWFVIGPDLASLLSLGSPGTPAGTGQTLRALESLALFSLLGAVMLFVAASAFGRLSVVSLRDVHAAERQERQMAEQRAADQAIREQREVATRREAEHARLDERLDREDDQRLVSEERNDDDSNDRSGDHDKASLGDRLHLPGRAPRANDSGQHEAGEGRRGFQQERAPRNPAPQAGATAPNYPAQG